jgi:hypothetical protein
VWRSLVESGVVDVDWLTLACWGPYFIPFPLRWVRANWRRGWSCGRWLASACVEVQQSSDELQCIKTACARHAASVDQGVCLSVRLWSKESTCLYDCRRFPHNFLGIFKRQQNVFATKRKSIEYWQALKRQSLVGNYLSILLLASKFLFSLLSVVDIMEIFQTNSDIYNIRTRYGACSSVVGWGTMLEAGRSRVQVLIRCIFFKWPNPYSRTMDLGSTRPLTEIFLGGKEQPASKADNLAAIC